MWVALFCPTPVDVNGMEGDLGGCGTALLLDVDEITPVYYSVIPAGWCQQNERDPHPLVIMDCFIKIMKLNKELLMVKGRGNELPTNLLLKPS